MGGPEKATTVVTSATFKWELCFMTVKRCGTIYLFFPSVTAIEATTGATEIAHWLGACCSCREPEIGFLAPTSGSCRAGGSSPTVSVTLALQAPTLR